jgi:hypothetical protein
MIANYGSYVERRWNELDLKPGGRDGQVRGLIQIAGELRHTTMHEGRQHPDVGLFFKNYGNFFHDDASGLDIATDILTVRDTDAAGNVTDPNVFAIVDCIVDVGGANARWTYDIDGLAQGADISRFRDAPVPAHVVVPDEPGNGGGDNPPPPIDPKDYTTQLEAMIAMMQRDAVQQDRIAATLEGIRRDLQNGAKLLQQLIAAGGIGNLFGRMAPAPSAARTGVHISALRALPVGFDRNDNWRSHVQAPTKGHNGEAQDR